MCPQQILQQITPIIFIQPQFRMREPLSAGDEIGEFLQRLTRMMVRDGLGEAQNDLTRGILILK